MSALPFDPIVPGSYENFQLGVEWVVGRAFDAVPLVPRAVQAVTVVQGLALAWYVLFNIFYSVIIRFWINVLTPHIFSVPPFPGKS
jgi:hypothetical protein